MRPLSLAVPCLNPGVFQEKCEPSFRPQTRKYSYTAKFDKPEISQNPFMLKLLID